MMILYHDAQPYDNSQSNKKLTEYREHDDQVMASSSPCKTPASSGKKKQYGEGEENVPMSNSVKKVSRRTEHHKLINNFDQRFQIMRQTEFSLISSLLPALRESKLSLLSKATSRDFISPEKKVILSTLNNEDSEISTKRCMNSSNNWQSLLFCCSSSQPVVTNQTQPQLKKIEPSRKLERHLSRNINQDKYIATIRTEDCIVEDEYTDDQLYKQTLMKRINSSVMAPGSRIISKGFNWSQQVDGIKAPELVHPDFEEVEEDSTEDNRNTEHYQQVISSLRLIKQTLVAPHENIIKHLMLDLPEPNARHKKKTIVFDMDETLMHCMDDLDCDPDAIIPILFPDEKEPVDAAINFRPFLRQCLEVANLNFQVGVFTASHKAYADAVLDYIDPERKYFQFRLYRDHCHRTPQGHYVKDLRIIRNRSLSDIVLIDNSVYSFAYQVENGVPIIPFYDDKNDDELYHLMSYMQAILECEDVRVHNQECFKLLQLASQEEQPQQTDSSETNKGLDSIASEGEDAERNSSLQDIIVTDRHPQLVTN